jgi:hypothetical protein
VEVTRKEYNDNAGAETPPQPEIPECGKHVWAWWWELNARRPPGFDALVPLSYTEIMNWILLTGKRVSPEEIRWLIDMDNSWLSTIAQEKRDKADRDKADAERRKGSR